MRKDKKKDKYSGLGARTKKRNEEKNSFPGGESVLSLPEGYEFYKPEKGSNEIEILPFSVGENYPDVVKGKFEKGSMDYVLELWVHYGVGVMNSRIICLAYNFNQPCPICEEREMMKDQGMDKKDYKPLYPKQRAIYNIYDHNDEKVKIFSVSYFLFEDELQEEADANNDEGDIVFSHPKIGKTIKFRAVETELEGNTYFKFKSFKFLDRDEDIDEEVLEQAITLDEYLNIKSYKQIKNLFHSGVPDEDTDEEDEEETQKRKNKKYFDKIKEDQEEEEEEESKSKTKRNKKNKCSYGHKFGVDTDEKDDCNECEEWDECDAEKLKQGS